MPDRSSAARRAGPAAPRPRIRVRTVLTVAAALLGVEAALPARGDTLPIIVTYELRKQRQESRLLARDPKAFWMHQIVTRLEDKKPVLPKPLKAPAIVKVTFVVAHDGHVVSKVVSQSSGSEIADKTAMAMVEKANPFPPMPAAMASGDLTFTVPVRFR